MKVISQIVKFFLITSCCYGQHSYFGLTQEQLMEESKRDGYRVIVQLVDSNIVYTLTNEWDKIIVSYSPSSELPSYIIYKEEE